MKNDRQDRSNLTAMACQTYRRNTTVLWLSPQDQRHDPNITRVDTGMLENATEPWSMHSKATSFDEV